MSSLPKISVVIPSLNKADYIEETLQSIVTQDYPDFEVIVQDGGSTDGTLEIIKKYAKKHTKLISWESKEDKGQTEAINKGLKKASGEIVTYINADDAYEKGVLKKVGEAFNKSQKAMWVAGKGRVMDESGKEIAQLATKYKNFLLKRNKFWILLTVNYLIQPSVFFKKDEVRRHLPLKGWKGNVLEYDLWLKLGKKKMPVILDDYLSSFRISEGSTSSTLYRKILAKDYQVVANYTKNPLILFLHYLNNLGRVATILFLKKT